MRLSIFFNNFGPYHVARISALTRECAVFPIEISASSSEYLWGQGDFSTSERTTLLSSAEFSSPARAALVRKRLQHTLAEIKPDVIVVPGWWEPASLTAIQWARRHNTPIVMMSESTRHDERRRPHREFVKRQIIRMCSAAIVGGTPHAAYMQELGMNPSAILDGYDVVDNEYFAQGAAAARNQAESTRKELKLPASYFLASSRLIPRKNLLRLIAAYDQYQSQVSKANHWSLVIIGYGAQEPEIRAEIDRRGLSPWVHLAGFQPYDRLPAYYGLARAFIHPALSEPWGLVVNEAMAAGLPTLVSRACGCAPDLIADGETGFQFDPGNVAHLSGLMVRISRDAALRSRLSQRARHRIQQWSPSRFGANLAHAARIALTRDPRARSLFSTLCLRTLQRRAS